MQTDFDKLVTSLEPAATAGESEWPLVLQASIAISLKRIADILTKVQGPDGELRVGANCDVRQV